MNDTRSPLMAQREAIRHLTRAPEPDCVAALLPDATWPTDWQAPTRGLALALSAQLRERPQAHGREGLVQSLMQEFALSSQEGIALMCLAEALLRIPDEATRDALIRDKVADGNWAAHLGQSPSMFVNAATWGLVLTGRLVGLHAESGLSAALRRVAIKGGEQLIRKGVDIAMRLLGETFVMGESIQAALRKARDREAQGFLHSYDMLGEAALTEADAQRYTQAYEHAIEAIGAVAQGKPAGMHQRPSISVKLSALHPRYTRWQGHRVMAELYPRLRRLALMAHEQGIGIHIDAEESERLDISLDLLEQLCQEPALAGWDGIGFVVQAYQKRCPAVIGWLADLARTTGHRLMVRLVKGAYWDSEIKRAQQEGQRDYPVYTRKVHTDVAYLACARRLLGLSDVLFPQFATHNAQSVAAILTAAGPDFTPGQYEFQCLHGMGEGLYQPIVTGELASEDGAALRPIPCRIYAPVGSHGTLLAYLVRRLLENGANTSFVNRVADDTVQLDTLVADPAEVVRQQAARQPAAGLPSTHIPLPTALYGRARTGAPGLDLHDEATLSHLTQALRTPPAPLLGHVESHASALHTAVARARAASTRWSATPAEVRAQALDKAADLLDARRVDAMRWLVHEAGKTWPNAQGEVREAIDFLRFDAAQARLDLADIDAGGGTWVCISPWNFPLAIFIGQVAAALAAGQTVLAKPAEQTPQTAAWATALLHEAGIPSDVLQLLPGQGDTVGAGLVALNGIQGVLFTGSNAVARQIQRSLANRLDASGRPLTLVAETGGVNTMLVDSSALPEQVVQDVMASAFDSAGQRCSALRMLCVQEDVAERVQTMLLGAMQTWRVGPPQDLAHDMGPLIDAEAAQAVRDHIARMAAQGHRVHQFPETLAALPADQAARYIPPTVIELNHLRELPQEVFGPVLHVLRHPREQLDDLLADIARSGWGLTLGAHSRIDETLDRITAASRVGNLYINRNMIGAVVGVQPFGGEGLSGTGPKAGGPLYLHRLLRAQAPVALSDDTLRRLMQAHRPPPTRLMALRELAVWLETNPLPRSWALLEHLKACRAQSIVGLHATLPGPTGERNSYDLRPRGPVWCEARTHDEFVHQLISVLACDGQVLWPVREALRPLDTALPPLAQERITWVNPGELHTRDVAAVMVHGHEADQLAWAQALAQRPGPIVPVLGLPAGWLLAGAWPTVALLKERSVSVNTTAAGGNASLLMMD
jgi:RHH-type proline utilization regulon transcriptional repressor/proline dehydrogenase/delta 1-pyrroline-5-carboxylate dehydrogenase